MANEAANLILDMNQKEHAIRAKTIAALQAGAEFVVVLVEDYQDGYEQEIRSSMGFDDTRYVLEKAAHDMQFLYPGANN